jgi:hypothetical protein
LYKDDINAAFRRIKYHPDIAPAFAMVLQHMLCIPVGIVFRAGFSPSFFCNTSETRALAATASLPFFPEIMPIPALATALIDVRDLAATASSLLKGVKMISPLMASIRLPDPPSSLEYETMRNHLVPDPMHPHLPAVFAHGSHHVTFVDDNMMAAGGEAIMAVINSSILSAYFLYGFPREENTNRSHTTTRITWG